MVSPAVNACVLVGKIAYVASRPPPTHLRIFRLEAGIRYGLHPLVVHAIRFAQVDDVKFVGDTTTGGDPEVYGETVLHPFELFLLDRIPLSAGRFPGRLLFPVIRVGVCHRKIPPLHKTLRVHIGTDK